MYKLTSGTTIHKLTANQKADPSNCLIQRYKNRFRSSIVCTYIDRCFIKKERKYGINSKQIVRPVEKYHPSV